MPVIPDSYSRQLALRSDGSMQTDDPFGVGGLPAKPTGLSATPGSTSASLSWSAITGADSIAVYYREGTEGAFTLATDAVAGDATSYNLTGIDLETLYNWYITATNAAGTSEASDIASFTTTDSDAVSGGNDDISWSAENGLSDGQVISVTSSNLTLSSYAPEKFVWCGFGDGWMYDQDEDAPFAGHTVGSETLWYEDGAGNERRHIKTINGIKTLFTRTHPQSGSRNSGGYIDWDTGSEIGNDSHVITYARVLCEVGVNPSSSFQWKQERVNAVQGLGDGDFGLRNSIYVTETTPSGSGERIIAYAGNGGAKALYGPTARHGRGWTDAFCSWKPNAAGSANGNAALMCVDALDTAVQRNQNPTNSSSQTAADIVTTDSAARPRYVGVQDYIGNVTDARDIDIYRTDIFFQRGGGIFVLTDTENPLNASRIIPLIPVSHGSEWVLKLWKNDFTASYSSMYLSLLDYRFNVISTVSMEPVI